MKCSQCPDLFCKHRTTMAEQECVYDEHYEQVLMRANENLMYQTLDWQSFRREAAKDILAAANASEFWENEDSRGLVEHAIELADLLIEKLKEEKQ